MGYIKTANTNRNALVIPENKRTSSVSVFTLRFSVDFLWIMGSEATVTRRLRLEQEARRAPSLLGAGRALWSV